MVNRPGEMSSVRNLDQKGGSSSPPSLRHGSLSPTARAALPRAGSPLVNRPVGMGSVRKLDLQWGASAPSSLRHGRSLSPTARAALPSAGSPSSIRHGSLSPTCPSPLPMSGGLQRRPSFAPGDVGLQRRPTFANGGMQREPSFDRHPSFTSSAGWGRASSAPGGAWLDDDASFSTMSVTGKVRYATPFTCSTSDPMFWYHQN